MPVCSHRCPDLVTQTKPLLAALPPQPLRHALVSQVFQAGFFAGPFGNVLHYFPQDLHTRTSCSKAKRSPLSHHLRGSLSCLQPLPILPIPVPQGRHSPEFSLSAGQQMTCSVLPLVQYSAQYLVRVEAHRLFHTV